MRDFEVISSVVKKLNEIMTTSSKFNMLLAGEDEFEVMDIDNVHYICN